MDFFFFRPKTGYELGFCGLCSGVCSSDPPLPFGLSSSPHPSSCFATWFIPLPPPPPPGFSLFSLSPPSPPPPSPPCFQPGSVSRSGLSPVWVFISCDTREVCHIPEPSPSSCLSRKTGEICGGSPSTSHTLAHLVIHALTHIAVFLGPVVCLGDEAVSSSDAPILQEQEIHNPVIRSNWKFVPVSHPRTSADLLEEL